MTEVSAALPRGQAQWCGRWSCRHAGGCKSTKCILGDQALGPRAPSTLLLSMTAPPCGPRSPPPPLSSLPHWYDCPPTHPSPRQSNRPNKSSAATRFMDRAKPGQPLGQGASHPHPSTCPALQRTTRMHWCKKRAKQSKSASGAPKKKKSWAGVGWPILDFVDKTN